MLISMEFLIGLVVVLICVVALLIFFILGDIAGKLDGTPSGENDGVYYPSRRFLPDEPCPNGRRTQSADHIFLVDEEMYHMTRKSYFMEDGKLDSVKYIFWSNEDRSKEPIIFDDSDVSHCVRVVSLLRRERNVNEE